MEKEIRDEFDFLKCRRKMEEGQIHVEFLASCNLERREDSYNIDELINYLRGILYKDGYGYTVIPAENEDEWVISILGSRDIELGVTDYVEEAEGRFYIITYEEVLNRLYDWSEYLFYPINIADI